MNLWIWDPWKWSSHTIIPVLPLGIWVSVVSLRSIEFTAEVKFKIRCLLAQPLRHYTAPPCKGWKDEIYTVAKAPIFSSESLIWQNSWMILENSSGFTVKGSFGMCIFCWICLSKIDRVWHFKTGTVEIDNEVIEHWPSASLIKMNFWIEACQCMIIHSSVLSRLIWNYQSNKAHTSSRGRLFHNLIDLPDRQLF